MEYFPGLMIGIYVFLSALGFVVGAFVLKAVFRVNHIVTLLERIAHQTKTPQQPAVRYEPLGPSHPKSMDPRTTLGQERKEGMTP